MPSDHTFDFLFIINWRKQLRDNSLALPQVYKDNMVSSHYLELSLFDHWNVSCWVDWDISCGSVVALNSINLIENISLFSLVANGHQTSCLGVQNTSEYSQVLWNFNSSCVCVSTTAHFLFSFLINIIICIMIVYVHSAKSSATMRLFIDIS